MTSEELAKRAIHEYESWLPQEFSWHTHHSVTFWHFLRNGRSETDADAWVSWLDKRFFEACVRCALRRLFYIHPINIAYLVWTFARADFSSRAFMDMVGDHLCDGLLPALDRCSLASVVWSYAKLRCPHGRLFDGAAEELRRPVRVRTLAPVHYCSIMIAYAQMRTYSDDIAEQLVEAMADGISSVLEAHDPQHAKCDRSLCLPFRRQDGREVWVDAFNLRSLSLILGAIAELKSRGPAVANCLESIVGYVERLLELAPPSMRKPVDAQSFMAAFVGAQAVLPDRLVSSGVSKKTLTDRLKHAMKNMMRSSKGAHSGKGESSKGAQSGKGDSSRMSVPNWVCKVCGEGYATRDEMFDHVRALDHWPSSQKKNRRAEW